MDINIRLSEEKDIDDIMAAVKYAQEYFKNAGIDQWQDGYPNRESIASDIQRGESYIFESDGKMIATAAISFRGESTYDKIYDGEWLSDYPYTVVHRVAVSEGNKGKGISHEIMKFAEKISKERNIKSMKIDTHEDNKVMRSMLEKNGYTYCGIIYLESGDTRVAYEKLI